MTSTHNGIYELKVATAAFAIMVNSNGSHYFTLNQTRFQRLSKYFKVI